MAKEEKIIISVETVNAATSVKELNKLLKASKDALIESKEGSKEYKTALETAALATDKLAISNEKIKASLPTTSLRSLRGELNDAKSAMISAEKGSDAYNQALARAANAQDKLKKSMEAINVIAGSALGSAFTAAANGMGEMVNGLAAVSAGMQLMGVENEAVLEGMAKLQQLTAIATGLKGLPEMGRHFRLLGIAMKQTALGTKIVTAAQWLWNAAISANPITAIIVGIIAFTAAVTGLVSWMAKSNKEQEEENRLRAIAEQRIKAQEDALKSLNKQQDWDLKEAKAKGVTGMELIKLQLLQINQTRELTSETIRSYKEREKAGEKFTKEEQKALSDLYDLRAELFDKSAALTEEARLLQIEEDAKEQERVEKDEADKLKTKIENNKKRIEEEKRAISEINENLRQSYLSDSDKLKEKYESDLILLQKHQSDTTLLTQKYLEDIAAIEENERIRKDEKQKEEREQYLADLQEHQNVILEAEMQYQAAVTEYLEEETAKRQAIAQAEYEHKQAMQQGSFDLVSNAVAFAKLFADKNKALQKGIIVAEGAMSIAKIVTSTMAANAAVVAKYAFVFGGVALAAAETRLNKINAGIGIATSIAATAKALGALGGGGGLSAPSIGGGGGGGRNQPSVPQAPNIPEQVAQTRNIQTQNEIDTANMPLKAFVVETDLRSVQERAVSIESEASL